MPNTFPAALETAAPGSTLPPKSASPSIDYLRGSASASVLMSSQLSSAAPATPGTDGLRGWLFSTGRGLFARNDAQQNLNIPTGWNDAIVYAPTHQPAGGSCIESTTAHWRQAQYGYGDDVHFYVNWCNGGTFHGHENMNATAWKNAYVRDYTDEFGFTEGVFWEQIQASNVGLPPGSYDCWTSYMFNFSTGLWQQKFQACGVRSASGWSLHESYHMMGYYGPCASIPAVRAGNMQVLVSSGGGSTWWSPLDETVRSPYLPDPSATCWYNGFWTWYESQTFVTDWLARTPGNQ